MWHRNQIRGKYTAKSRDMNFIIMQMVSNARNSRLIVFGLTKHDTKGSYIADPITKWVDATQAKHKHMYIGH